MATFELLVGSHVVSPDAVEIVSAPARIESDVDLVAKFGSEKFRLVEGEVKPAVAAKKGAKAE
jgi:hypothetical protein